MGHKSSHVWTYGSFGIAGEFTGQAYWNWSSLYNKSMVSCRRFFRINTEKQNTSHVNRIRQVPTVFHLDFGHIFSGANQKGGMFMLKWAVYLVAGHEARAKPFNSLTARCHLSNARLRGSYCIKYWKVFQISTLLLSMHSYWRRQTHSHCRTWFNPANFQIFMSFAPDTNRGGCQLLCWS